MKITFKSVVILLLSITSQVYASSSLSYSGRLVNSDGSPVTGPVNLKFDLVYSNAPTVILCSQDIASVSLTNGVFHSKLDLDCTPTTLLQVLSQVPAGESVAIRVTDTTHSKAYSFQALHSMPFATIAKQIDKLGATNGQVLAWDGSKWAPTNPNTASGSVTSITTGAGLVGGPITNSGTISIADGGVTDAKLASGISRAKLSAGTPNYILINNGAGALSEIALMPVSLGGTGSNTVSGARTNLGLGTAAVANIGTGISDVMGASAVPSCLPFEKLQMTLGPTYTWTCVADNDSPDATKLPLAGGTMSGAINMGSQKITNLGTPTVTTDAATKAYVDARSSQWTTSSSNIYFNTGNVGVGTATPSEKISVTGNIAVDGRLKLQSDTGNFVELKAPASLAASLVLNFPANAGSSGYALTTDGSGNLSWAAVVNSASAVGGDLTGSIANAQISPGVIVDADIAGSANIAQTKISGLTTALAAKEPTLTAGTTSQYYRGDKSWQTLNTSVVPEGTNYYFTAPRVLTTTLSGYLSGFGPISSSDSIISAIGKLDGNNTLQTAQFVDVSGDTMSGVLSMGTNKITDLGTPTAGTDAATKAYVDAYVVSATDWTRTGSDIKYTTGKVGVGTTPTATVHIVGTSAAGALGNVLTVQGAASSDGGGSQGISLIAGQSNIGRPAAKLVLGGSDFMGGNVLLQASQPDNNGGAGIVEIYGGDGWNNPGGNVYIAGGSQATNGNVYLGVTSGGAVRGNVGIGTTAASAKLEVSGQIVSKVYNNGSATTFNLANGNSQYTTANCGAMTLQNMVDGGSYTIAVQGATSGTCTFTDSTGSRTFRFSPANGATTASTHTIYSMQVMGSNVYVSWISGF